MEETKQLICKICGKICHAVFGLTCHFMKKHGYDKKSYLIEFIHEGVRPLCLCGCGSFTELSPYGKFEFNRYVVGHNWTGQKRTEENKEKCRLANLGNKKALGYRHDEETKQRMSKIRSEWISQHPEWNVGNSNPAWKGGISKNPYSGFNRTIKRTIKNRDKCCAVCSKTSDLCIHHIDYDKTNSVSENLITLCKSCHSKTNFNRDKWQSELTQIMEQRL